MYGVARIRIRGNPQQLLHRVPLLCNAVPTNDFADHCHSFIRFDGKPQAVVFHESLTKRSLIDRMASHCFDVSFNYLFRICDLLKRFVSLCSV